MVDVINSVGCVAFMGILAIAIFGGSPKLMLVGAFVGIGLITILPLGLGMLVYFTR